jgi:hypothetical protein
METHAPARGFPSRQMRGADRTPLGRFFRPWVGVQSPRLDSAKQVNATGRRFVRWCRLGERLVRPRTVRGTKAAGRPVAILLVSAGASVRGRPRNRPPGNDSERLKYPVKSTYFHIRLKSFLEALGLAARSRRHSAPCSAAVAFLGATRSPRSEFRGVGTEAISQVPGRTKQSIPVIQINFRQFRRLAGPLVSGRGVHRSRQPRILAACLTSECTGRGFGRLAPATTRPGPPKSRCAPALRRKIASTERRIPGVLSERRSRTRRPASRC